MAGAFWTAVLCMCLAASACSAESGEPETVVLADTSLSPVSTVTTSTTTVAPATVAPTTTTSTLATPPDPATTSDDWPVVWTEIMSVRDWVAAHPTETDVLLAVFAPDCPCLEEEHVVVDGLADLGLVAAMAPVDVLELREVARPREDRVVLGVTMYRPPFTFLEADGTVYQDDLGDWTETLAVSLVKVDGRWLVQSLEVTERILGS